MESKNGIVLSVKDLHIHYHTDDGVFKAVNGVSFDIRKGEALGLVGETGAGKTTTALGLMRLIPDPPGKIVSGSISFEDRDILSFSKSQIRKYRGKSVSMIFQDPMTSLDPVIPVGDQIAEVLKLHEGLDKKAALKRAGEMLEIVGISADRLFEYPHQFSGGMKQRVVIAIALACNPQIIIADEPTTALDVTIQAQVLDLMSGLRKRLQTGLLMISHDLGVIAEICDRVAIMYAGRIVEVGSLEDVYDRTLHPYTKGLFGSMPSLNEKVRRLKPIHGLMPDPANLPEGCPFHPRCPEKQAVCETIDPMEMEAAPGHFTRCHLYGKGEGMDGLAEGSMDGGYHG